MDFCGYIYIYFLDSSISFLYGYHKNSLECRFSFHVHLHHSVPCSSTCRSQRRPLFLQPPSGFLLYFYVSKIVYNYHMNHVVDRLYGVSVWFWSTLSFWPNINAAQWRLAGHKDHNTPPPKQQHDYRLSSHKLYSSPSICMNTILPCTKWGREGERDYKRHRDTVESESYNRNPG